MPCNQHQGMDRNWAVSEAACWHILVQLSVYNLHPRQGGRVVKALCSGRSSKEQGFESLPCHIFLNFLPRTFSDPRLYGPRTGAVFFFFFLSSLPPRPSSCTSFSM